jgi:hypothetical protein
LTTIETPSMVRAMRYAAPGTVRLDETRPPVTSGTAPRPGAAARVSSQSRGSLIPVLWVPAAGPSVPADHPYVRTFWTSAIGAAATADLLRLITAAKRKQPIRHPLYAHVLITEGLAARYGQHILVRPDVPLLGPKQLRRLSPRITRLHEAALRQLGAE